MIARLQSHPLKRALRADKMTLAALEATLRLYLHPEALAQKLPTLRQLTRSQEAVHAQAQHLQARLAEHYGDEFALNVMPCLSQIGSGSLPVDRLPSAALTFTPMTGAVAASRHWPPVGVHCPCRSLAGFMMAACGWICAALKTRPGLWR